MYIRIDDFSECVSDDFFSEKKYYFSTNNTYSMLDSILENSLPFVL